MEAEMTKNAIPCQSGRSIGALACLLVIAASSSSAASGPTGWAHKAAGFQSNGAVIVKSLAGGSYAGTQNPTGAVAKANQIASTQPPTVIIQATANSYVQAVPLMMAYTLTPPTCPTGYTSVFTITSSTFTGSPIFNIAGTRFAFAYYFYGSTNFYGFLMDGLPTPLSTNTSGYQIYGTWSVSNVTSTWAASLCTK